MRWIAEANKLQIKEAVETIFDVEVLAVNTMIMKPKRRRLGRKTDHDTACLEAGSRDLAPGERIQEFFEGI